MIKITVITVVFNNKESIENTIKSVLSQKYKNLEYIIIDGGSKDGTLEIIRKYENRIRYISEKDKGIYDAMNKGLKLSTGELIFFLNSDDIFFDENVIRNVSREYLHNNKPDYIYGGLVSRGIFKDGGDNIFLREISNFSVKMGQNIPHQTLFVKKEAFDQLGYFNQKLNVNGDYDFECRLVSSGKKGAFIKYLISYYNQNGYSSTGGWELYIEKYKIIKKYFGSLYASFFYLRSFPKYIIVSFLKRLGIAGFFSRVINKVRGTKL